MSQITSLFVHKVLRQVDKSLDKRTLLRNLGVDPDAPEDPAKMVSASDYYAFIETIAKSDPGMIDLPLRTGASMRCDNYGAFGLAWKSASNLQGSYERAERYARVLSSESTYEVEEAEAGAWMAVHRSGERRPGLYVSNEATIASIATISQEASSKPFQALEIHFRHSAPRTTELHERFFGCPVHFNSDRDALLVSRRTLRTSNQIGDPAIARFFDTHLEEEVSQLEGNTGLPHSVRIEISQRLSDGVPTISEIATRLGISGRTLQRRLSEQGYSFQSLVDEARRILAERLLHESDYSLMDVAFLTGFSDQSAFTRAFKRWAGQTPRSFRIEAKR